MIKEGKFCCDVMNKLFNKELLMTKKDKEDFKNSSNYSSKSKYYYDPNKVIVCKMKDETKVVLLKNLLD